MKVSELSLGEPFEKLIVIVRKITGFQNKQRVTVGDISGEIIALLKKKEKDEPIEFGQVIEITGICEEINEKKAIIISSYKPVKEFVPEQLVKIVTQREQKWKNLLEITDKFKDKDWKILLNSFLKENQTTFSNCVGGLSHHHDYIGGLLWHTLSMLQIAEAIERSKVYKYLKLDWELLKVGIILHDLGKIKEYEPTSSNLLYQRTDQGKLIHHISLGTQMVQEKGKQLGIPLNKIDLVSHLILSSHGRPEWGAATKPMIIEAQFLHLLDYMDANLFAINNQLSNNTQENSWTKVPENRKDLISYFNHLKKKQ